MPDASPGSEHRNCHGEPLAPQVGTVRRSLEAPPGLLPLMEGHARPAVLRARNWHGVCSFASYCGEQHVAWHAHAVHIVRSDGEADIVELVQILFSYPPDKPVSPEVVSFCFPHDVQPSLLERTPSMSALNELIYSQQYQHDDAVSFVFLLKVSPDAAGLHCTPS